MLIGISTDQNSLVGFQQFKESRRVELGRFSLHRFHAMQELFEEIVNSTVLLLFVREIHLLVENREYGGFL